MVRLAEVMAQHGESYLKRYAGAVLPSHVRAIRAIECCRTAALGGHLVQCDECGQEHLVYHSCRNRACPQCGHDATHRWLERQRDLLLPVPYFHVVFTLPSELRRVVRQHQRPLLTVLFRAAFESLSALCSDPRWLGGEIGALAVLHTWTRTLEWHPHLHLLVPSGGLACDGRTWVAPKVRNQPFLVPVRALAEHFRGRFLSLVRRAVPSVRLPEIPWGKRWVVFAKPAVQGPERVLQYLGRYVHRTALTDKALIGCNDNRVSFTYRDSRDGCRKTMTLGGHEFLRRFLQHVLPKGTHRVRAFGLLHPSRRQALRQLQQDLADSTPEVEPAAPGSCPTVQRCPSCHGGCRPGRSVSDREDYVNSSGQECGNPRGMPFGFPIRPRVTPAL